MKIKIFPNIKFHSSQRSSSPQVSKPCFKGLRFISFADEFIPMERTIKEQCNRFVNYGYGSKYLGQGLFSKVYELTNLKNIVIKQSMGTDTFEAEEKAMRMLPSTLKNSQRFVARAINDADGKYFILSTKVAGKSPNPNTAPITQKTLKNLFDGFYKMDEALFYHGDLNNGNIKITPEGDVNFIDFQWASKIDRYNFFDDNEKQCFPQFIPLENSQMYEMAELPYYLTQINNPAAAKTFLNNYLIEKSAYHTRRANFAKSFNSTYYTAVDSVDYENAQAAVFKEPTEDILTDELLKLQFFNSYREAYRYVDPNIKNKNILPIGSAYLYTLNQIRNFEKVIDKQKEKNDISSSFSKYLERQKRLAFYWKFNIENWSKDSFNFPLRQIRNELKNWESVYDFNNPEVNVENFGKMLNLTEKVENNFFYRYPSNFNYDENELRSTINFISDKIKADKYCGSQYGIDKLFEKKAEFNKAFMMLTKSYEERRGLDIINSALLLALRGKQLAQTAENSSAQNKIQKKIIEDLQAIGNNTSHWSSKTAENVFNSVYDDILYSQSEYYFGYKNMNQFNIEI